MYKIIIGMFFIAFNFPVKIEYVIIGLIPDFVGYLLILHYRVINGGDR